MTKKKAIKDLTMSGAMALAYSGAMKWDLTSCSESLHDRPGVDSV